VSVGWLLGDLRQAVGTVAHGVQIPIITYFLMVNSSYLALILLAWSSSVRHTSRIGVGGRREALGGRLTPGVSVIMPAYNEAATIVPAVQAMLSLRYPRHEVVVVDDGSKDDTIARLTQAYDLVEVDRPIPGDVPVHAEVRSVAVPRDGHTRLVVVGKENSGKAEAVNVGINASAEALVAVVDADSLLDPDALLVVTRPFADDPVRVVAAGGMVRVANGCSVVAGRVTSVRMPSSWLARIQVVEYLRAYLLGRTGWSRLGALILISGAFGVFRRDVLVEVGGLLEGSLGEDFELVMRLHKRLRDQGRDYRIAFIAEPICWTEVPVTISVLHRQRRRWHRGLWETLWAYHAMSGRPRYGVVGLVALPWHWLFELLAPVFELAGLALIALGMALGVVNVAFFWLLMSVAYGYAILVTLAAMALEEMGFPKYRRWRDLGVALLACVVENLGYRQVTAWWRAEGWWSSLRGRTLGWGTMTRQGFASGEEGSDS
jgi:cellulose synthase/poly-beta-1,6-N-acetylglucosamine synthase-like glycosyltransferase